MGSKFSSKRIVGGNEAQLSEFPWLALLEYRSIDAEAFKTFRCSGTLISPQYVLTGMIMIR